MHFLFCQVLQQAHDLDTGGERRVQERANPDAEGLREMQQDFMGMLSIGTSLSIEANYTVIGIAMGG